MTNGAHGFVESGLDTRFEEVGDTAVVHFYLIEDVVDEGVFVLPEGIDDKVTSDMDLEQQVPLCHFVVCFVLGHGLVLAQGLTRSV